MFATEVQQLLIDNFSVNEQYISIKVHSTNTTGGEISKAFLILQHTAVND